MEMNICEQTYEIVVRQLKSFWPIDEIDKEDFLEDIVTAIKLTEKSYNDSNRIYYIRNGFSTLNTTVYTVFLYYLANLVGERRRNPVLADKIYYLNKILNGMECYWNAKLPEHFIVEHPVGTVLGRAIYGDYFCVYQGVTVGASFRGEECVWPVIGDFVTMYANSSIIGECHIGNNVIIAANTFIYEEDIPDNCVVFGSSPNLSIKKMSQKEVEKKLIRIWNFDIIEREK